MKRLQQMIEWAAADLTLGGRRLNYWIKPKYFIKRYIEQVNQIKKKPDMSTNDTFLYSIFAK